MANFVTSLLVHSNNNEIIYDSETAMGSMIICFDFAKLCHTFKVDSNNYNVTLHDWDILSDLIFKERSIGINRDIFCSGVDCVASLQG